MSQAHNKGKDKRWLIAGICASVILGVSSTLAFAPTRVLNSLATQLYLLSSGGSLATPVVYFLRTIGTFGSVLSLTGIFIVNNKRAMYVTSLMYTLSNNKKKGFNHWDEVLDDELVLGAIPGEQHFEQLSTSKNAGGVGITSVLTLLEPHELVKSPFYTPVQSTQWQNRNIKHLWIRTEDYEPVSPQELIRGADWVHEQIQEGGKVYVHCKAGRGRSTAVCAVYLIKYHGLPAEEAIAAIKKRRSHINLNKRQRQGVFDAEALVNKQRKAE